MKGTLREILNLPDSRGQGSSAQGEEFAKTFRKVMAGLNQEMQLVAAQANADERASLEAQRTKLYEAFQKALKVIDPADPKKGAVAIDKVQSAVKTVEEKASLVAADVVAARDRWLQQQANFDDAALQIGELEEAGHPKAGALLQLSESIRKRVTGREYRESLVLLEQLLPRLEKIHSEFLKGVNEPTNGSLLSTQDRESMWKELAEIERRLEGLLKEYQIAC